MPSPSPSVFLPIKSKSSILVGNHGTSEAPISYRLFVINLSYSIALATFLSPAFPSISTKKLVSRQLSNIIFEGIDEILVMLTRLLVRILIALLSTPGDSLSENVKLVLSFVSQCYSSSSNFLISVLLTTVYANYLFGKIRLLLYLLPSFVNIPRIFLIFFFNYKYTF